MASFRGHCLVGLTRLLELVSNLKSLPQFLVFSATCCNVLSDFSLSHQALLQEAHDVEVKKQKVEEKIERQLAFNREDTATEVTFINGLLFMSVVAYLMCVPVFCRRRSLKSRWKAW